MAGLVAVLVGMIDTIDTATRGAAVPCAVFASCNCNQDAAVRMGIGRACTVLYMTLECGREAQMDETRSNTGQTGSKPR